MTAAAELSQINAFVTVVLVAGACLGWWLGGIE